MNWLILLYFLQIGYSPAYESLNVNENGNMLIQNENIYHITFDAEVVMFDYLFIGGATKTYFKDIPDNHSYYPFESDYLFKAGLRYKNIEAGFRHFCLHPVRPYEMYYQPQESTNASYEEFYIKIKGEY